MSITQQPQGYTPSANDQHIVVKANYIYGLNMYYQFKVFVGGETYTFIKYPNDDFYAHFNPKKIVENYVSTTYKADLNTTKTTSDNRRSTIVVVKSTAYWDGGWEQFSDIRYIAVSMAEDLIEFINYNDYVFTLTNGYESSFKFLTNKTNHSIGTNDCQILSYNSRRANNDLTIIADSPGTIDFTDSSWSVGTKWTKFVSTMNFNGITASDDAAFLATPTNYRAMYNIGAAPANGTYVKLKFNLLYLNTNTDEIDYNWDLGISIWGIDVTSEVSPIIGENVFTFKVTGSPVSTDLIIQPLQAGKRQGFSVTDVEVTEINLLDTSYRVTTYSGSTQVQQGTITTNYITNEANESRGFRNVPVGSYNLNNLTDTLSGASQPLITSSIDRYTIEVGNADGYYGLQTFNVKDDNCIYEKIRLHYLNRRGGYDAINFSLKNRQSFTGTKAYYRKPVGSLVNGVYTFNSYDNVEQQVYADAQEKWVLSTDWITDEEAELSKELFTSPVVLWEKSATEFVSVNIKTSDYAVKKRVNEGLATLEASIELSYYNPIQAL